MSSVFHAPPRNVHVLPTGARGRSLYRSGASAPGLPAGREALRLVEPHEELASTAQMPESDEHDPLARTRTGVEVCTLDYRLPGDPDPRRITVPYFGRIPGSVLIVGIAQDADAIDWPDRIGLPVRCRLTTGTDVFTFDTTVTQFVGRPSPHLHLLDPVSVTCQRFRRAPRVPTRLPAVVRPAGQPTIAGLVTNLSEHGAEFRAAFLPVEVGAALCLTFRLSSRGHATTVTLRGHVRSRQLRGESVTAGIEFCPAALDEQPNLPLLLRSQVYELALG